MSEDVYDEIDQQNEEAGFQNQVSSFNDGNSGQNGSLNPDGSGVGWEADNYFSPWDIWYKKSFVNGQKDLQPSYMFTNGNMEDVTPYNIQVFAYAGLAYFDGADNGTYTDPYIAKNDPSNPTGFVVNLNSTTYPNLYPTTNQHEVGNLVKSTVINVNAYPAINSSFRMEDITTHMPMGMNNKYLQNFNFPGLTAPERTLLMNYGKVFFYEVRVFNKITGAPVLTTIMHPQITTLPADGNWRAVRDLSLAQVKGISPLGLYDLHYYHDPSIPTGQTDWDITRPSNANFCDSREVVFRMPMPLHEVQIDPIFKLTLGFQYTGLTGWVNSALYLNLHS